MLQVSLYGRLGKDAQAFETKTGNPMSAASVAVDVGGRDGEAVTLWVRVLAFGRLAEALAKHTKGETLAASGRLELSRWTGEDGVARETWQLVADYLHSLGPDGAPWNHEARATHGAEAQGRPAFGRRPLR